MRKEFLKFLAAGGIAAIVNLGSRYLLNYVIRFEVAVAIAYGLGFVTAYILSSLFVFARH
jgi:putative flippase GtrA